MALSITHGLSYKKILNAKKQAGNVKKEKCEFEKSNQQENEPWKNLIPYQQLNSSLNSQTP